MDGYVFFLGTGFFIKIYLLAIYSGNYVYESKSECSTECENFRCSIPINFIVIPLTR